MPGTRSSSVDVLNNGRSGRSNGDSDSRQLLEESMRRYETDRGDGLIGRLLVGGPTARYSSQSTTNGGQQSSNRNNNSSNSNSNNADYGSDYPSAARAA